jgi:hypothetical protein
LFRERTSHETNGPSLAQFWGAPQDAEENALSIPIKGKRIALEQK